MSMFITFVFIVSKLIAVEIKLYDELAYIYSHRVLFCSNPTCVNYDNKISPFPHDSDA